MSKTRTATRLGIGFVVASFAVAVIAYPTVPDQMIIRWWVGPAMELHVDYASKTVGLFVAPVISAITFVALRYGPGLVGGAVADDTVRHVFAYVATGVAALLLLVELALVYLN